MRKIKQYIKHLLVDYLSLPSDTILELPRITIIGDIHAYVENHKGIAIFTDKELRLYMTNGFVQITGTSFRLKMMLPEEILLEGTISNITFIPDKT